MSRGLSFENAVLVTVNTMGLGVLNEPTRLVASLMDLCDESLPELRVAERNCDAEFLSVFAAAVKNGTVESLRDASLRGQAILCNQRLIDNEMAKRVCEGISLGLERFLFPGRQTVSIAQQGTEAAQSANVAQGSMSSEQAQQTQRTSTTKSHKKGRNIVIAILVIIVFSFIGRVIGRYTAASLSESVETRKIKSESESVIRNGVQKELDELNSNPVAGLDMWTSQNEETAQQLSQLGISLEELLSAVYQGLHIQIASIDINGNTATVNLEARHKDLSNIDNLQEAFGKARASGELSDISTEDEMMKWYGAFLLSQIKEAPITQSECKMEVSKEGNMWSIDEEKWRNEFERLLRGGTFDNVSQNEG